MPNHPRPLPAVRADAGRPRAHLYFILNPVLGLIKIGVSTNVAARLHSLECAGGVDLRVLAVIKGGARLEIPLHRLFEADRMRGEWFCPSDALLALIDDPASAESVIARERTEPRGMTAFRRARERTVARVAAQKASKKAAEAARDAADQEALAFLQRDRTGLVERGWLESKAHAEAQARVKAMQRRNARAADELAYMRTRRKVANG